ncbi:hypothetical protein OAS39_02915 [Pirellulales bacterium]|nr:hypothetical protein [Pirellulales bacterium]
MANSKNIFSSPRFILVTLVGSIIVGAATAAGSVGAQVAISGVLVSALSGMLVAWLDQQERRDRAREDLLGGVGGAIAALQEAPELARLFRKISGSFQALSAQSEPVLRSAALTKLLGVAGELDAMSRGTIVFHETESWRTAYRELLQSKELKKYRSAAWVKSPSYWQDAPGKQSIRDNYDAINRGVLIERIFILPAALWDAGQLLPDESVRSWIVDQHNHGVWVTLCHEEDIAGEPDLPLDFGIYGVAVGVQTLDEQCRTREFKLQFSAEAVKLAEDRWQRLELHATSLSSLLDKPEGKT